MPRISYFYGISIYMYFEDHAPPHIHVWYSGAKGRIDIQTGTVLSGNLPPRCIRLVRKWLAKSQTELALNWELATKGLTLTTIHPLS